MPTNFNIFYNFQVNLRMGSISLQLQLFIFSASWLDSVMSSFKQEGRSTYNNYRTGWNGKQSVTFLQPTAQRLFVYFPMCQQLLGKDTGLRRVSCACVLLFISSFVLCHLILFIAHHIRVHVCLPCLASGFKCHKVTSQVKNEQQEFLRATGSLLGNYIFINRSF